MVANTVRRPGVPRQRAPRQPDERRRSAVYGIPCLAVDKKTGIPLDPPKVIVGYIGQSVQTVKQREEQHRDGRFGDVIVGGSFTIVEGWWTQAELDERERWYIERGVPLVAGQRPQRPVYNYDYNTGNPDRIEVWRAVEHRQLRQPGWVPPPKGVRRPAASPGLWARVWLRAQRVRWTRRRVRFALWSALWLALSVAAGVWVAVATAASATDGLLAGPAAATVLAGLLLRAGRPRKKR